MVRRSRAGEEANGQLLVRKRKRRRPWTDGFHGTYRARNGWVSHLILQYNSKDGATNVRRDPLNFDDSDARTTAFVAFESLRRRGALLQRAFDVSYLPESLLKDGTVSGRREDYVGLVLRGAARFPNRSEGKRLRFSGEVGYAPETQTNASAGLPGAGDVDGWAWNFTASFMDFAPDHSIGINYAQTDAGWLISPQYRNNDELFEIQYQWRRTVDLAIDVRVRWRRELEKLTTALQKREEVDAFVRFTWGFTLKR